MNTTRLYFDERWIGEHGIGRFARELRKRLPAVLNAKLGGTPSQAIDTFRVSAWLIRHPRRMLFTPGFNAPLVGQRRTILSVHDLNHIDAPTGAGAIKQLYYRLVLRRACRRAAGVVTVSNYSRERILAWSGAAPERVINVGNGVSDVFTPNDTTSTPPAPGAYFLAVSNRKPHKNEDRLLNAFARADLPGEVKLYLTGRPTSEQTVWLSEHALTERIVFLGAISDATLASYYRGARALLFVSLYEGFGLPADESMACGTPVLASNVTSLPEVVGEAAILITPTDSEAIRRGIERLWTDTELRQRLSVAGLVRAKAFRWNEVAYRVRRMLSTRVPGLVN